MVVELPELFEQRVNNISDEELKIRGITREQMRIRMGKRILKDQQSSPKIGAEAPDFELEVLDATGKRTGNFQKLSDYRGTPVALIFGSYT